jgi:hypothetical protein
VRALSGAHLSAAAVAVHGQSSCAAARVFSICGCVCIAVDQAYGLELSSFGWTC